MSERAQPKAVNPPPLDVRIGCPPEIPADRPLPTINLFTPLTIQGVTFRNRVVVSPMCQYWATDGFANDWHLVHLGARAAGGAGLTFVEATAVTADGRITPGDMGLWSDEQIEPLARIARFLDSQGSVPGIQIAHSGRKGSCEAPWLGGKRLTRPEDGGWDVVAPSPIPFRAGEPDPIELDEAGLDALVEAFAATASRALAAGFRIIEVHAAHGYLLHSFLSPLSNKRTDRYGGSLENRIRFPVRVVNAVRAVVPEYLPLFVRISATDWVDGGWDLEQSIELSRAFCGAGVNLIDVSSGALVPDAKIPVAPNFQVPFAAAIRRETGVGTGAVGMITDPRQAEEIITTGSADLVFVGREMLRNPNWTLEAQDTLRGEQTSWPVPYGYAVGGKKRG